MSIKRLIIAIDCDDVLVLTTEHIIPAYNRDYGTQLQDLYTPVSLETWGTDDERIAIERVGKLLRSKEHANIQPSPGALMAIPSLALKHELHLVTGRSDYLEPATQQTLRSYFPGCFTSIEHTNFFEGNKKRSKGEVCATIGADVLIDDHIIHGESALKNGLRQVIIFGDYPWNQAAQLPEGMVRCIDWPAVTQHLDATIV